MDNKYKLPCSPRTVGDQLLIDKKGDCSDEQSPYIIANISVTF